MHHAPPAHDDHDVKFMVAVLHRPPPPMALARPVKMTHTKDDMSSSVLFLHCNGSRDHSDVQPPLHVNDPQGDESWLSFQSPTPSLLPYSQPAIRLFAERHCLATLF